MTTWVCTPTAGHDVHRQSAIYDLTTARTIAIVYDGVANGPIIAAAPEALGALMGNDDPSNVDWVAALLAEFKAKHDAAHDEDPEATLMMFTAVEDLIRRGRAAIATTKGAL